MGKLVPRLPSALVGVCGGIAMMAVLDSEKWAVTTLGAVPAGFLKPHLPAHFISDAVHLLPDAAGIALICFCGSMVTAKSFAVEKVRSRGRPRIHRAWSGKRYFRSFKRLRDCGYGFAHGDQRYYRRSVAGERISGCPCYGIGPYSFTGPLVIYSDRFARRCAGLGWCIAFRLSECVEDT